MEQYELFDANVASSSRVVKTVHTELGRFGNRTDLIVVDGSTVKGTSLLGSALPQLERTQTQSSAASWSYHL